MAISVANQEKCTISRLIKPGGNIGRSHEVPDKESESSANGRALREADPAEGAPSEAILRDLADHIPRLVTRAVLVTQWGRVGIDPQIWARFRLFRNRSK